MACLALAVLISSCGPKYEKHTETRYGAVTWSPDGKEVAYLRIYLEYTQVSPRFSLFIGEDSKQTIIEKQVISVCINNAQGSEEDCLAEVDIPSDQQNKELSMNIAWVNNQIQYRVASQDNYSTGILQINRHGGLEQLVADGSDPLANLMPNLLNSSGEELYSGFGNYGYFSNQTIYIFDHDEKTVRVYLHDPLSSNKPITPPYSVTQ